MKSPSTLLLAGVFAVATLGAAPPAGCGGSTPMDAMAQDGAASDDGASSPGAEGRHEVKAKLTGFQETPAISTPGHGKFQAKLSDDETTVTFELTYADLKGVDEGGAPTVAHVHLGQRGVAGGAAVFLCGGGGKPACPKQPATVTGTFNAADVMALPAQGLDAGGLAELIQAARAGVTYVNVHTTHFPAGEIRGQIHFHH